MAVMQKKIEFEFMYVSALTCALYSTESELAIYVALQDDDHQQAFSNFSDSTCQGKLSES